MKKILLAIVVAFAGIFGLASCEKPTEPQKTPTQVTPEQKTFTVSFETDGGSEVAPIEVKEGEKVTLPANPTKEGLTFGAWYKDVDLTEKFDANAAITEDITLYAQWNVTLTFNSNGGSEVAAITKPYSSKATVYELPAAPTKEGVVFAGWYTDEAFTTELSTTFFPKKNTTAYAKWLHTDGSTAYVVDGFNLLDKGSYAIANNEDGSVTYTCVDRELNIQKLVGWMYSAYLHPSTGADLVDAEGNLIYTKLVIKVQGTAGEKVIFKVNDNGAFEKNVELTGEVQDVEIDLTGLTPDKAKSALVIMPGVHQDAPASNVKITSLYFTNGAEGDALKTKDVLIADWAYDTQNKLEQYVGTADYSFGLVELKQNVDGYQVVSARVKGTAGVGLLLKLEAAKDGAWIETTIPMTGEDQIINWVVPVENLTRGDSNIKLLFCLNPGTWGAANGAYVTFKNVSIQKLVEADDANKESVIYFHTDGGNKIDPIYANIGATVEAPENPTKKGYTFAGWYTDAALTQAYTFDKMGSEPVQLYAKWEKNAEKVSVNLLTQNYIPNDHTTSTYENGVLKLQKKETGGQWESVKSVELANVLEGANILKVSFKGIANTNIIFKVNDKAEFRIPCTGEVQYLELEFNIELNLTNNALFIMPGADVAGASGVYEVYSIEVANYNTKVNLLTQNYVANDHTTSTYENGVLKLQKKETGGQWESAKSVELANVLEGFNILKVSFKGVADTNIIFKVNDKAEFRIPCTGEVQYLELPFNIELNTANAALFIMPGADVAGASGVYEIYSIFAANEYDHVNLMDGWKENDENSYEIAYANNVLSVKKTSTGEYAFAKFDTSKVEANKYTTIVVKIKGTAGDNMTIKLNDDNAYQLFINTDGTVQTFTFNMPTGTFIDPAKGVLMFAAAGKAEASGTFEIYDIYLV